jgi:serine/threonine protein phosphatase PrpC
LLSGSPPDARRSIFAGFSARFIFFDTLGDGGTFLATAVAHYAAAAATDRGRRRPSNEDAFGYSVDHGVYVVCDGMGGAAAGEVASSLAVDEMMRLLTGRDPAPSEAVQSLLDHAEQAVADANAAIFSRAKHNRNLSGMGTTLVSLVTESHRAWMINVGDSRGYRIRQGRADSKLEQITLDHSFVEEQLRLGRMNRAEASRSPFRNVITRALGTQVLVTPDIFELETEPGDLFLLCSDGLTRELSDPLLEAILQRDLPLPELCLSLIKAANEAGGQDNITCLLVRAEA